MENLIDESDVIITLYNPFKKKGKKSFILPDVISPFYTNKRIPRKLKKKVKLHCGIHWGGLTPTQQMWYYIDREYRSVIVNKIATS